MEYSYKFRIYPNHEQENLMQRTFGCCRFVWNYYLAKRKNLYTQSGTTMNYNACSSDMTQLKKALTWLKEVDATALQSSLRDLDTAFQNFFRRVKQGQKPGYPRFKSKHNRRRSYKSKGHAIRVLGKAIWLPKLGFVKCRISKEVKGRILSATVRQNPSGKYFVALCCTDVEIEPLPSTGAAVGLDMGLKAFAVTSEGVEYPYPNHKYLTKGQKKLAKFQRQLSRKAKGSKRQEKARIRIARVHERISSQWSDMLHKLSTSLVRNYDVIAMEGLTSSNMVKNQKLARSTSDASWSEFRRQLEYKAN